MGSPSAIEFDFEQMPLAGFADITLGFRCVASHPGPVHGLAGWFDVAFEGSVERVVLSTAPDAIETHWTSASKHGATAADASTRPSSFSSRSVSESDTGSAPPPSCT